MSWTTEHIFLYMRNGVTTLKTENHLNIFITETFEEILKKDNDPALFDTLLTVLYIKDRETIYNGMKSNVIHYGLKPFYTDYEYLDNIYWNVKVNNAGSTELPTRAMIPYKLIRNRICRRNKDFNLRNIIGDQRLLNLLPEKTGDFYPLSDFCKDFTNFQLEENDFTRINGYESLEYKYTNRDFKNIHSTHSS